MGDIFLWLFVVASVWAITVTVFCFYRNPLPFPDRGHRCFAVPDEKAAKVVAGILDKIGDLPERFTFDSGPTHQTLLWDNTTVIIHHDKTVIGQDLPPNGLSVVVSNPKDSAEKTAAILKQAGFTAIIKDNIMPEMGDKFVLLTSNAFDGWILAFRRHILVLGNPPNKRKLIK
ncbi:MAG: hypothetical protein HW401_218 [Parcubacteria group bacterium]|nr:hypothetical protein [Parcubacteria group bacterium]